MTIVRAAILATALGGLAALAAPASAEGSNRSAGLQSQSSSRLAASQRFGRGDFGNGGRVRRDRVRFPEWRDERRRRGGRGRIDEIGAIGGDWADGGWSYEHNRTAMGNGYFGQGESDGAGRFDYDRGYPYDHYNDHDEGGDFEPMASPRHTRCRTDWVPDGRGDEAPVSICRG